MVKDLGMQTPGTKPDEVNLCSDTVVLGSPVFLETMPNLQSERKPKELISHTELDFGGTLLWLVIGAQLQ